MKYLITEEKDKKSLTDEEKKLLKFLMDKDLINSASQEKIQQLLGSTDTAGEKDAGKERSDTSHNNVDYGDEANRKQFSEFCNLDNNALTEKLKEKMGDRFISLDIKQPYRLAFYKINNEKKALIFPPRKIVIDGMPSFKQIFNIDKQSKNYEITMLPRFDSPVATDPLKDPYVKVKGEAKATDKKLNEHLLLSNNEYRRLKLLANIEK